MKKNTLIFLLLLAIGIVIHYPSLNLSLYGDDWIFIHYFFSRELRYAHISNLPGILSFITPYGVSLVLIGSLYNIFGTHYFFYYAISLVAKVVSSFALFLSLKKITSQHLLSFLASCLLLVGYTGIQTTDWFFYVNVYLAIVFFIASLYFLEKLLTEVGSVNLVMNLLLSTLSIIVAPVRLFALVFLVPIVDVVLVIFHKYKCNPSLVVLKNCIYVILVTIFWAIGLFGSPMQVYTYGSWKFNNFADFLINQPVQSLKSFLYWVGSIAVPNTQITNKVSIIFAGIVTLGVSVWALAQIIRKQKFQKAWSLSSGFSFFVFLATMWYYSPMRFISSSDRYLLPTFSVFCLWLGIIASQIYQKSKRYRLLIISVLITLIVLHIKATSFEYQYLLSKGRSANYIHQVDKKIINSFPSPITSQKIIFLESDDGAILHSVQFGLSFRALALTKTRNVDKLPLFYSDKTALIADINKKILGGESKESLINSVVAFKASKDAFNNITSLIRQELLETIK